MPSSEADTSESIGRLMPSCGQAMEIFGLGGMLGPDVNPRIAGMSEKANAAFILDDQASNKSPEQKRKEDVTVQSVRQPPFEPEYL